jgi:hypothetical protein
VTGAVLVGVTVLLAAQNVAPERPRLWVETAADLRCPDEDAVLAALLGRFGDARVAHGPSARHGLGLRVVPHGPRGVRVLIRRSGKILVERTLAAPDGHCSDLADTVALLAEAWLGRGAEPPPAADAPPARAPTTRALAENAAPPTAEADQTAPETDLGTETPRPAAAVPAPLETPEPPDTHGPPRTHAPSDTPASPGTPAPPEASAPAAAERAEAVRLPAPALPAPASGPATASPSPRPWAASVSVEVGALLALDASATPTGSARAAVGIDHGRWRYGVRGALETSADLDPTAGQVVVRRSPVGAYLGYQPVRGGQVAVTLIAGAGVEIVTARTAGYAMPRSFDAVEPIAFAGAQGEWWLGRRFGLVAAVDLLASARREQYTVANVGTAASTSRVRAGLALGGAWRLH